MHVWLLEDGDVTPVVSDNISRPNNQEPCRDYSSSVTCEHIYKATRQTGGLTST